MRCVITGCALILAGHPDQWLAGDLFEVGDCYLFNGNQDRNAGEPSWQPGPVFYAKRVDLHSSFGGGA
jgi:hypothetical protein